MESGRQPLRESLGLTWGKPGAKMGEPRVGSGEPNPSVSKVGWEKGAYREGQRNPNPTG